MQRVFATLLSLLLPALLWTAAAGQVAEPPSAGEPAPPVREQPPELYYMEDAAGRLVPVPGFRYRDFMELFRIKEGLGGPALPPPAMLESVVLTIDARQVAAGSVACPATVECRIRQARGGWAMVPLTLGQFLLDGPPRHEGPGRMLLDADPAGDGYRCWLEAPVDQGADVRHTVSLSGRVPVEGGGRLESFAIALPAAVASRLEIRSARQQPQVAVVPAAAGEIEVLPAARDRGPAPGPGATDGQQPAGSRIVISGLAGDVRVRVGEAAGGLTVATLAEAFCTTTVRVDGRTAAIAATLSLAGLPPGGNSLSITLPPRTTLRRVGGDGALAGGDPAVELTDDTAAIVVDAGSDGSALVELDCESPVDPSGGRPLEPLGFAVSGLEPWRQRGRVSLVVEEDWQAAWDDSQGVRRVAPPAGEQPADIVAAFAYDAQPASLPLRITPRRSRVVVEPEYRYAVAAGRVGLDARLRVAARGAAVGSIALELDPSWTLGDVGPAGIVDTAGVVVDRGRTVIPFVQPLAGEAVIEIEAARAIDPDAAEVSWKLPVPKADLVGPAVVVVTSDSDIELVPDAEASRGLVRQTSSAVRGDAPDRIPLVYRLDAAEGRFAAGRRFLPRRVEAVNAAVVTVAEREISISETLRLDVLHLPLEVFELDVPADVAASGTLEIRWEGELLDAIELDARDAADGAVGPLLRMQAVLPEPLLGRGELTVAYRLPLPEIPPEATAAVDLPLLVPADADTIRQTVAVAEPAPLAVTVRDASWRPEVAGRSDGGRSWSTASPRHSVPLAISARGREAVGATVIEAAWLQTRLFPDRREDTARYVVTPAGDELVMQFPETAPTATLDIRVDGERVVPQARGEGRFAVPMPAGGGRRLVVVQSVASWGGRFAGLGLPWPLPLAATAFAADVLERRFVQELAVLPDDHVLGVPRAWTSQQSWTWSGLGWQREAVVSPAELTAWLGSELGRTDLEISGDELPSNWRRSVFAGVGSPGRAVAWVVPTWCIVLTASGITLAVGLALVSTGAWRIPGVVVGLLATVMLAAAAAPQLVPLVGQAALPGVLLSGLAGALRRLASPPSEQGGPSAPGSVSSLTRAAAPTVSLIVASSENPGSTATAGRGAS